MTAGKLRDTLGTIGIRAAPGELADALWLAMLADHNPAGDRSPQPPAAARPAAAPVVTTGGPDPPPRPADGPDSPEPADPEPAGQADRPSSVDIRLPEPATTDHPHLGWSAPVQAAASPALANQLALARACRPLRRQVARGSGVVLDEIATADLAAEQRLWLPMVRPAAEPALDLALVIDASASMALWSSLVDDIRLLCERLGAFRNVRLWYLVAGGGGHGTRPTLHPASPAAAGRDPRELIDPSGGRLILVVTDGVRPDWRPAGPLRAVLAQWAAVGPLAIVQPFPQRLWDRSALRPALAEFRPSGPGRCTARILRMPSWPGAGNGPVPQVNPLAVPLLELEPGVLERWARLVAGSAPARLAAVLLPGESAGHAAEPAAHPAAVGPQPEPSDAIQLVRAFRRSVSPAAYRLAGYLSVVAPLNLPVMRMVQENMPAGAGSAVEAGPAELAEVFLGGLLQRLAAPLVAGGTRHATYDFAAGTREILQSTVTRSEALQLLNQVGHYLVRGQPAGRPFPAVMSAELGPDIAGAAHLYPPFARMASQVLTKIGGRFADAAAQLQVLGRGPADLPPDQWLTLARVQGAAQAAAVGTTPDPGSRIDTVVAAYQKSFDNYADDKARAASVAAEASAWLLCNERPDLALAWCNRLVAGRAGGGTAWEDGSAVLQAEILLGLGQPGSALAVLAAPDGISLPMPARCLTARAHLALRQPTAAVAILAEDASGAAGGALSGRLDRELWLAKAYGELFEIGPAQDCFDRAERLISPADAANRARLNVARARLEMDVVGDLARAAYYLDPAFDLPPADPTWADLRLARAGLADRRERPGDVQRILTEVSATLAGSLLASGRVRAALAGLAVRSAGWASRRPAYLALLTEELARVVPAARLAMLADLPPCRPVVGGRQAAGRLWALISDEEQPDASYRDRDPRPGSAESLDQAWRDLVTAWVMQMSGAPAGQAGRLWDRGQDALANDSFLQWHLLAAGAATGSVPAMPGSPELFQAQYGPYRMLTAAFLTEWVDQYGDLVPYQADRWLTTAEDLLSAGGERQTARHARLFEVQARRARAAGQLGRARELADAAREVWAQLRDPRGDPPGLRPPEPDTGPIRELTIAAARRGEPGVAPAEYGDELYMPAGIVDSDPRSGAVSWGLAVGRQLATSLGSLLADAVIPESVDVRARFPADRGGDAPWELVNATGVPIVAHQSVRFVWRGPDRADQKRHEVLYEQRALTALGIDAGNADGIPGPAYRRGLAEFHSRTRPGLDPRPDRGTWRSLRVRLQAQAARRRPAQLRVHVVQPMTGGNLDTLFSFRQRIERLTRSYQEEYDAARGQQTPQLVLRRTSADVDFSQLRHGTRPEPAVDVLHVCTVMEASVQMPVLGLVSGPPLTVAALDDIVRRLTRTTPPLVVLDVLAQPGLAGTRQQLLMRNRFAQQLLELGSAETIIATGLAREQDTTVAQWTAIARALAERCTPAEICRRIQRLPDSASRSSANDREAHAVACTATALFSSIRPEAMIEPGLLG